MTGSRAWRACLVAVLLSAGGLLPGAPARADTVEQNCVGTEVTSYDPPLTFTSRPTTITVSGVYPSCTDPQAPTGTYAETFTLTASCLALLDSGSATRGFVWGGPQAQPSEFQYNVTATEVGGQLVVSNTGVITGGRYAAAGAQQVITLVTPNILQCLGSGIANVTGATTLIVYRTA